MRPKEYRDMTQDDLKKEIDSLTKSLFDLRFKKVTDVVENPAEFRKLRKELARAKTILHQKELGQARLPVDTAQPPSDRTDMAAAPKSETSD